MEFLCNCKYLVLSGGGVNGLSELGAIEFMDLVLKKRGGVRSHFQGFAGVSIGAFISLGLVCGETTDDLFGYFNRYKAEMSDIMVSFDSIMSTKSMKSNFYPFDYIIREVLLRHCGKADVTFKELYNVNKKNLNIVVTNLTMMRVEYFDHLLTPTAVVSDVVLASMAYPFLFPPVELQPNHLYCDGGMLFNFPFHVFPSEETIGISLQHKASKVDKIAMLELHPVDYVKHVFKCLYHSQDAITNQINFPLNRSRVIVVHTLSPSPFPSALMNFEHLRKHGYFAALFHFFHFQPLLLNDSAIMNNFVTGLLSNRLYLFNIIKISLVVYTIINAEVLQQIRSVSLSSRK
jgi:predicted acylesterase/phospholipase RssA